MFISKSGQGVFGAMRQIATGSGINNARGTPLTISLPGYITPKWFDYSGYLGIQKAFFFKKRPPGRPADGTLNLPFT